MTLPFVLMIGGGAMLALMLVAFAFSGPNAAREGARRLSGIKDRNVVSAAGANAMESQLRRVSNRGLSQSDARFARLLPNPAQLQKRLSMTGKNWSLSQYMSVSAGLTVVPFALMLLRGLPLMLALPLSLALGLGLPHKIVGFMMKRRVAQFTTKFPDAIELLVRGLRSGLPITETIGVVGHEFGGPVGEEFRAVSDKMKIGRTLDVALQETADRLGTPEFQFFCITIAIQRETGGNLAETLSNLADVLRKRAQMKLKIKAMSSESKASAMIVGALPFVVFTMILLINADYMMNFFIDPRLMITGGGGLLWMATGGFIMAKMVSFEI